MSPAKKKKDLSLAGLNKLVQQQSEILLEQENQIMSLTETTTILSDKLIETQKENEGIIFAGAVKMAVVFADNPTEVINYPLVSRYTVNNPFIEFTYLQYVDQEKALNLFNLPPRKKKETTLNYIKRLEGTGEFNVIHEQHLVGSINKITSLGFFTNQETYADEDLGFFLPDAPENVLTFKPGEQKTE
jgi:hypothetical protein